MIQAAAPWMMRALVSGFLLGGSLAARNGDSLARSFDDDWRFFRGDSLSDGSNYAFSEPSFDDSGWRQVDVPHDWSIEDLPPRDSDASAPVLGPRYGIWAFSPGDESAWSAPDFDDSNWQRVKGGQDWREASNYTDRNATGWYRQRVEANALLRTACPMLGGCR